MEDGGVRGSQGKHTAVTAGEGASQLTREAFAKHHGDGEHFQMETLRSDLGRGVGWGGAVRSRICAQQTGLFCRVSESEETPRERTPAAGVPGGRHDVLEGGCGLLLLLPTLHVGCQPPQQR